MVPRDGLQGAGDQAEEGGLPRPVPPHDAPALPRRHREGDVSEQRGGAEFDGKIGEGQNGHGGNMGLVAGECAIPLPAQLFETMASSIQVPSFHPASMPSIQTSFAPASLALAARAVAGCVQPLRLARDDSHRAGPAAPSGAQPCRAGTVSGAHDVLRQRPGQAAQRLPRLGDAQDQDGQRHQVRDRADAGARRRSGRSTGASDSTRCRSTAGSGIPRARGPSRWC